MATVYYGGQAVIEGVMMRGASQATTVVRDPDGSLVSRTELLSSGVYRSGWARLPFVRGLVMLWEMLVLGTRMMLFSAGVQARRSPQEDIPRSAFALTLVFSLAFAVGVFFLAPLLLTRAGGHWTGNGFIANLLEGLVRLAFFLGYLVLLGRVERLRRVFQYHGAEHKTINAYEAGAPLTPQSVREFGLAHVRCGTAFLLWVVVLSILVFALLGHPPLLVSIVSRIVLVPLIAAAGYEVLRLSAKYSHIGVVSVLLRPGLWMQRLTTREPDLQQIEVAIEALTTVLAADGQTVPGRLATPLLSPTAEVVPS